MPNSAVGEVVTWDYVISYNVGTNNAVSYSVEGPLLSYPYCPLWAASTPSATATADPALRETYKVSLALGKIEQSIQKNNIVTATTLTCPSGLTIFPGGQYQPPFLEYDNGCAGTTQYVTVGSNTQLIGPTLGYDHEQTLQDLSQLAYVCVRAKVGSNTAEVPFTGFVNTQYTSWKDGVHTLRGQVCSPKFLAGYAIAPPPCDARKLNPGVAWVSYNWFNEGRDLAFDLFLLENGLGAGSFGGTWQSSAG